LIFKRIYGYGYDDDDAVADDDDAMLYALESWQLSQLIVYRTTQNKKKEK